MCCDEQLLLIRNLFIFGIRKSGCHAKMNSHSATPRKTLPSGTENANVDAKKNGLLIGDCMEFQPGNDRTGCCFFSMNQKPWQQTCHDLKKWRVLAKVSVFSCWDTMELKPGQMPVISVLGIFTCGATSTAHLRFTTCLQKGKP